MSAVTIRRLAGDLALLLLIGYPVVVPWLLRGLEGVFAYLAADAFVYLAIAERSLAAPFFTMDGTHPTNGFHPLWQGLLGLGTGLLPRGALEAQLHATMGASLVLVAVALLLITRTVTRITGSFPLALLTVVPGWYFLVASAVQPHHGASWSYVNGMESPVSLLCLALFLETASRRPLTARHLPMTRTVTLMAILTAMTFSRLDDGAMLLALGIVLAVEIGASKLAMAAILPGGALLLYLAWNQAVCGMALPVSAMAKSAPALLQNLAEVVGLVVPVRLGLHPGEAVWGEVSWRVLQLVLPAAMAAATLLGSGASRRGRHGALMTVLSIHILIRFLHSLSSSSLSSQGHWYFAVSVMSFNVLVSYHLARFLRWMSIVRRISGPMRTDPGPAASSRAAGILLSLVLLGLGILGLATLAADPGIAARKRVVSGVGSLLLVIAGAMALRTARHDHASCDSGHRISSGVVLTTVLLFLAIRAAAFCDLKMRPGYNGHYHRLFTERARLAAELEALAPASGLVELDDGILAYSLGKPTLSGLGFAMDREAYEARRAGQLLALAHRRGMRVLASLNYFHAKPGTSPDELRDRLSRLEALARQDLGNFEFSVLLEDPTTGATFITFRPRAGAVPPEG